MTNEETIERIRQNKAAAEYYAGQSRITAEIENALKDIEAFDMAIEALQAAEPKTGEWIDDGCVEKCNQCGEKREFPHWNFCPNCGARMLREDGEA